MGIVGAAKGFWRTLRKPPATISLGVLSVGGFITGIVFWGGFNTALEVTNTEAFCISCHEMRDNVYQELQETVHWENRTGVRATCPDCHVPHEWTNKIARKMQASKEVWGAVFGTINTREKFLAKREELARHEWARLSANGSLECRNCHDYDSMDWDKMSDEAVFYMRPAAELNTGCIECHKGIAHHLPERSADSSPVVAALEGRAATSLSDGQDYFAYRPVTVFAGEDMAEPAGQLNLAARIEVLETKGDKVHFEMKAWRKDKGYGRVLYDDFGLNARVAVLEKEAAQNAELVQAGTPRNDDNTGLDWSQVTVKLWAAADGFVADDEQLWDVAAESYSSSCSSCHAQPDPDHFSTNAWPALFAGMVGFTNMDATEQELVLTYLQNHSSDNSESH
ncbi:pentaheme c-type cytochrome TorC [Shimia haliotis]|uniref:Cytochrome c-type protein n=1 Tax=Shimia haliotis TaxID=1280847 RepID=A0A1I4FMA0_9RHOB|nr:pentaheme c-type cytochrome TorC [Shimia haliotis]SFL19028.1 trimethylamine-N-oxide reductase (cytochrome c), cytochrome c-type subunit TorC [Shimia haliotis]